MEFITHTFNTNIIICEQDTEEVPSILKGYTFDYIKTERSDGLIHRTRQLNIMAHASKTPYIANYDADVLMKPKQYIDGMELLRKNEASIVIPYAGPFWDVNTEHHNRIMNEKSVDFIDDPKKFGGLMNKNSVGGVILWDREHFINGGMENEKFISWGFEDNERFIRFRTLGYELKRTDGILLHLNHHRTSNSNHKHKFYHNNLNEYNRIRSLDKVHIRQEVNSWKWCNGP
ncbi:MAG: galactosyltransferase-related protein [Atribacterota bacterium]